MHKISNFLHLMIRLTYEFLNENCHTELLFLFEKKKKKCVQPPIKERVKHTGLTIQLSLI